MDRHTETRLAKAAYRWLTVSPILTISTLLLITSLDFGSAICENSPLICDSNARTYIGIAIGIIVSACWHLILLQYVNNQESEFVRRHGGRALTHAGIRTGIALIGLGLDWSTSADGSFSCVTVIALMIAWVINFSQSKKWIEADFAQDDPSESEQLENQEYTDDVSTEAVAMENSNMNEIDPHKPEDILNDLLEKLRSIDDVNIFHAIASLKELNYSSEAIRNQLEALAARSDNEDIRNDALALLNSPSNRAVQKHFSSSKLERGFRFTLLQEIDEWEKKHLISKPNADLIRRRYDFDFNPAPTEKPQTQPKSVTAQQSTPTPQAPASPPAPAEPRLSLLQTLTSEASIKIYLYLGAFFVIAAAAILGAVVPELRLPILIIGTVIFGGLAIAIKKRLPQPSFALFIVFSFLLPITANSLEETLRQAFNLTTDFTDAYWGVIFVLMAVVWVGSTWLYESRLFSLTALGSLILACFRVGDLFEAEAAYYTLLTGLTTLTGLAGTWLLKKWKDDKFALPLFLASQLLQGITLAVALGVFGVNTFEPSSNNLLNLVTLATWMVGTVFYLFSEFLYPFFAFPWLTAATFIPMPWLAATAFDLESLGSSLLLFSWGNILAVTSEPVNKLEKIKKYGLPILMAAMPSLALGIFTGFVYATWMGLIAALGVAILFAVLHVLQNRWWLWTLALINFVIAYFAFFQLELIQKLDIFFGYQLVGITLLLLIPDLLLKKDWSLALQWRLPLRTIGAAFLFIASTVLFTQENSGHIAINYFVLAVFVATYALAYRNSYLAYLPATYLALTIVYALDAFDIDAWLPALTLLAFIYYFIGIALRNHYKWGDVLRTSGMALGILMSFVVLSMTKETGGWYVLGLGLLFISETYLRGNGWFEIGAPAHFTIGIYLILHDFKVEQVSYHLLAYSLIWLISDLLTHLTFKNPRPMRVIVRFVGGILSLINFAFLFAETDIWVPVIGFGIYTLLFLTISLLYRQPNLLYTFTASLPLFVAFLFRAVNITQWIHPVIIVAVMYYTLGTIFRAKNRATGWDLSLLYSGLGVGVIVSISAPILGGLDASIPVAIAATLWAAEAYMRRNAWLAFPANSLYLLAYFIILFELNVDEPQFFSIGTALLGLMQHYLLTRAKSTTGAFLTGMFSQLVLLGTTYIQMIGRNDLSYFFLLFIQSLVVLVYGIVIRSRSLTFFPIGFVALGVVTVVYSALKDIGTIFVIGCTGILLLMLGITAVLLRERISKLGEKLSDWQS